jgi:hypothetical protein
MKHSVIAIILTAVLLLATGTVPVLAQNFQGMNTLQNIASEGQTAGKYVVNIAFVFCGIVGAICLIPAGIKAFKGESQSKDAITGVGLGLIAIFVILAIIKAIMAFT